jgi:hypothetical protein
MMDGLLVKGKKEKHEEQVEFAKFQQWCDSTRAETTKMIARAADKIEVLTADIAKATADAEQLGEEIAELEAAVAQMESEVATATAIREKELAEYEATHTDLSESIDALERAIMVLKAKEADVPQSLLQLQSSAFIPAKAKAVITAFLQEGAALTASEGAPEANAYEFQSGGVVAMLEKLRLKFQDQRTVVEKEEMNTKANYEQLMQHLTDDIKYNKAQIKSKTATKTQRLEDAAVAKEDKASTETQKAADEKKLSDTLASCDEKSKEFEQNQVVRAEEIRAIEQAQAILQSPDVTGNADTYLPTFLQVSSRRATSLAQLRGESPREAAQRKAMAFLQDRARKTGSRYLALIAEHMQGDPFVKVKKMIKDLIVKLMEQANAEAEGKAYCDTELGTNKLTRENKQAEVEELTANVEQNEAKAAQLTADIKDLAAGIADLQGQQAEATALRTEEKAVNTKTVEDAKVAQTAVEKALSILKEFYAKAEAIPGAALLQDTEAAEIKQQMADAQKVPYKGMQASSGGIFGMLEVVLSDFARLEAETASAEDAAQEAYDKFMAESTQDIAVKSTAKKHNEDNLTTTEALIVSLKKELALTQEELDAALAYYEKLKPTCVDLGLSYEERVQAREEEIQSLKEALAILQQEDLA